MRIFGRDIDFHVTEKFKGFFATGTSTQPQRRTFWMGERAWKDRCTHNLSTYMSHTLAKSQILTVAGQCVADGIFLEPATDEEPHGARAEDALAECEDLNKRLHINSMLHETFFNTPLLGSCFWEKTFEPRFDARIIPQQETIEPAEQDDQANIIRWRQRPFGKETASWTTDEIIHFAWNITSLSWPYGTSLYAGTDRSFEILDQITDDFKEYAHKNAFPIEMFAIGNGEYVPLETETENIKSLVKTWEPGKKIITSYPIEHKVGGVGDREPKGVDKILAFIKEDAIDGTMTPPVSYQYSSTYASSKEMGKQTRANLILPLQRIVADKLVDELYKPYLESLGYSVKLCPTAEFEPPDAGWVEEAQVYSQLIAAKVCSPEVAAERLGLGDDWERIQAYWEEQDQKRMELFQKQAEQARADGQLGMKPQTGMPNVRKPTESPNQ